MTTCLGKSCSFGYRECLSKLLTIYVFSYFPFGFGGRVWDLIISVPDHSYLFTFQRRNLAVGLFEMIPCIPHERCHWNPWVLEKKRDFCLTL